jgi:hypothetical protein
MSLPIHDERRQAPRHPLARLANLIPTDGGPPRFCLVTDFSEGGVRVNANDGTYKVVWRNDPIVGAKFVGRGSPLA